MTGSTNDETPDDAGSQLDESAITPSPKADVPPLVPVPDRLHLKMQLDDEGVCIEGAAEVHHGLHAAVNHIVVIGFSLLAAIVMAGLGWSCHISGTVTLILAIAMFLLTLTVGLIRTPNYPDRA